MVMPAAMVDPGYLHSLVSFVGIKTTPGTDPRGTLTSIRRSYKRWGVDELSVDVAQPIRPAEIVDAQSVRSIPLLVGGLLGVSLVLGLSVVVAASVRARRRELAMLRTLGFTGGQLRTSVRVQAAVTMLAALLIGVPLGVIVGRLAWRAFASGLAVVMPPTTPVLGLLLTTVGALAAVVIIATVPAFLAGRARPAETLRTE
jgi:putative ABC transport system permease protein